MALRMSVEYPDSLPDALCESREQFEQEARLAMAVKLFERRRLSSGMAAALAGLDRVTFLLRLQEFGVPVIDLSGDELSGDVANV